MQRKQEGIYQQVTFSKNKAVYLELLQQLFNIHLLYESVGVMNLANLNHIRKNIRIAASLDVTSEFIKGINALLMRHITPVSGVLAGGRRLSINHTAHSHPTSTGTGCLY